MNNYKKDESKSVIAKLVENFDKDVDRLKKSSDSSEALVEDSYIKPLFLYLNWNIHNTALPHGKEVFVVQYKLKRIGKRPDYLLRVPDETTGKMKHILFMEAKHPRFNLEKDINYIRQCYLYANSTLCKNERPEKRVSLSLLTDFEEFRLFDCNDSEPLKNDKLDLFNKRIAKNIDWKYKNYIDNFDELWDLFEYSQVCKGSLDDLRITDSDLINSRKAPDMLFLEDLRNYRIKLAQSMYNIDNNLSEEILTAASQLLLNRIVFIKLLADKDLEADYLTQIIDTVKSTGNVDISFYEACQKIFDDLNKTFNGSIFSKREELDLIKVRDKDLREILEEIRPEKAIYSLDSMPVRIIGTMYEEFLGDTIVKKGRGVGYDVKPEVRKAGGVYYTPEYIVDYITENTVNKTLFKCKKPEDVEKIKIVDPACGSGSFLISAYDKLLNWHINYYKEQIDKEIKKGNSFSNIQQKYKDDIYLLIINEQENNYSISLTIKRKSNILINSIFGVDLDEQAVEIAKFSLSLKAVEDYHDREELFKEVNFFETTVLPDLSNNIKCGNSLIGSDFYIQGEIEFTKEVRNKVNCFDWEAGFSDIFKNGGFDIVIGNPPWGADIDDYVQYFENNYPNCTKSHKDSFKIFIEKGFNILKNNGCFGFIVPSAFMLQPRYIDVRRFLRDNTTIQRLWNVGDGVFGVNVNAPCGIFIVEKSKPKDEHEVLFLDTTSLKNNDQRIEIIANPIYRKVKQKNYYKTVEENFVSFYRELKGNEVLLEEVLDCKDCGIKHQRVGVGMSEKGKSDLAERLYYEGKKQNKNDIQYLIGADLDKNGWYINKSNQRYFRADYKKILKKNEIVYFNESIFNLDKKIVWRQTSDRIRAAILEPFWFANTLQVGVLKDEKYDIRYLLAILNSKYLNHIYLETVKEGGRVFPQVKMGKVKSLPFRCIDFSNKTDKTKHDNLVSLVDKMLILKQQEAEEPNLKQKEMITRQITGIENAIDKAVYELYELTEEEITVVEGK